MTITFSSRVHESTVQFVEPVQTACVVAHDVLVVHQVGHARECAAVGNGSDSISPGSVRGGGGTGTGWSSSLEVVGEPHGDAARGRLGRARRAGPARPDPGSRMS